mmetsp:Transcript_47644/g.95132  ORF Transcript_47644/g.95132 Transcript_47644/m.95132 type:complete len:95 (+) Transcript_47644:189-473(+)
MTHSHGAGGDHLCKFGLEALLLEAVRVNGVKLPEGFDLSTYLSSYDASKFFLPQLALAHMYVHIQLGHSCHFRRHLHPPARHPSTGPGSTAAID